MEKKTDCPCKRDCPRHGDCEGCRAQHEREGKYPPACQRRARGRKEKTEKQK